MRGIECCLLRGGTSKGAYFNRADLPSDEGELQEVLFNIMGTPDRRQIDGIGGGTMLTSKVALVSKSELDGVDLDYKFVQIAVDRKVANSSITCGNILSGVGSFAIETGIFTTSSEVTKLVVRDVNIDCLVEQTIQTPNGRVKYSGDVEIAGVPFSGSGIEMRFMRIGGAKTGKIFPTGNKIDIINNIPVSCIDVAMPTVFLASSELGKGGHESRQELEADKNFMENLEELRCLAGEKMGFGDVSSSIIPKITILSKACAGGSIRGRYFTPYSCHEAFALSGGFCLAAGCFIEGTVMSEICGGVLSSEETFYVEHLSGMLGLDMELQDGDILNIKGKVLRTARLLFRGEVYIRD